MPPTLALFITTAFVFFLFKRDISERAPVTRALCVPLCWLLIIASRFPSEWLGFGGAGGTPADLADGSPLDRIVFLSLQAAGLVVLFRRRVSLSVAASRNLLLVLFLSYCSLSITWSDFPLVALKRWVKVLGHPIMVLVVATEPNPREALVRLLQRAAYVLIPYSILLIKYYPALGRDFSGWTGEAYNIGVTTNKNSLGCLALLLGFFMFWHFLTSLRRQKGPQRRTALLLDGAFLTMIAWVLSMANSATSFGALVAAISTVLLVGLPFLNRHHMSAYLITAVLLLTVGESLFGVSDTLIAALGRDAGLTGRVELWKDVFSFDINPIVGAGFESFWMGKRVEILWAKYWWHPNQAHNGYVETYLSLGWLGVGLLAAWIISAFKTAGDVLVVDFDLGRFQMGVLVLVVVYNYTEATFKALHVVWFVFYLVTMNYPRTPVNTGRVRANSVGRNVHHLSSKRLYSKSPV